MRQTICPCVAAPVARKISRKARRAWQMGRCGLEGGAAVVERRPWSPLRIAVREGSLRSRARGGRGGTGRRRGIGSGEGTRTEREGGTKCVETMRAWLWRRCGRSCTPKPCTPKPCTPKPCTLCLLGAVAAVLCCAMPACRMSCLAKLASSLSCFAVLPLAFQTECTSPSVRVYERLRPRVLARLVELSALRSVFSDAGGVY